MKNIYILLFGLLIMSSCIPEQPQNHLTLSGKLENTQDSFLTISNRQGIIKEINIKTKKITIESIELSISFGFATKNHTEIDIHPRDTVRRFC